MKLIHETLTKLRARKRELVSELTRTERAINSLAAIVGEGPKPKKQLTCIQCNKTFNAKRKDAKYCSRTCLDNAYIAKHPERAPKRKGTILIRGAQK